jgi:nucleoside-diphosphate-sugar epimerase
VAKLASERLGPPRVTYRDERRLGETNIVDVRDVAKGHLLAAERGSPGERYVLSGHDLNWVELFERGADLSGVRHPLVWCRRRRGRSSGWPSRSGCLGSCAPRGSC